MIDHPFPIVEAMSVADFLAIGIAIIVAIAITLLVSRVGITHILSATYRAVIVRLN